MLNKTDKKSALSFLTACKSKNNAKCSLYHEQMTLLINLSKRATPILMFSLSLNIQIITKKYLTSELHHRPTESSIPESHLTIVYIDS